MYEAVGSNAAVNKSILATLDTPKTPVIKTDDKPGSKSVDQVNVSLDKVYKSLTVLGDEIISKLDELLQEDLPGGIRSLKPEEHTSEATADRIVAGVTGLFPAFAEQNPELEGEELVNKFMETVRGGIKEGYDDAVEILGNLGAFEFNGVKSGIEETMRLVDEKLTSFADQLIGKKEEPTEKIEEPTE